jgi:hypothetical protein
MLIIDTSTGTVLTAHTCVLVPDDALSEAEWEALDNMSDTESADIGRERGRPVLNDAQALDAVAALFSATEWSSDLVDTVVDTIRATGRTIEDLQ